MKSVKIVTTVASTDPDKGNFTASGVSHSDCSELNYKQMNTTLGHTIQRT